VAETHHLRPQGSLFRQGLVATLVFLTPVFVVLYALTAPNGAWRLVLGVQVVATVVATIASSLFFRTGIWISPAGMRERGYFGRVTYVPVADMASVIIADTFTGVAAETSPQLFVCDEHGKQLIRMRGQFWSKESMDIVVATLDVPHTALGDTISQRELRNEYPGLLYWFERRPVLAALAFAAGTAILGAIVLLILTVLGVSPS